MNTLKRTLLASALALLSLPVMADSAHPKIGFSIDDLRSGTLVTHPKRRPNP